MEANERKLLAFTDSVQDAAHRAGFFSARTYRFNLRTLIADVVADAGTIPLDELGETLLATGQAETAADHVHALTPPDLLEHPRLRDLWTPDQAAAGPAALDRGARKLLVGRLGLEATVELGLRSRLGRTLELTGTVAAGVEVEDFDKLVRLVAEARAGRSLGERAAAAALAGHFTVYNYDRRGREESGDTPPYAVERELEDLEALIELAGGSAHLYGVSSGGALVLEAAVVIGGSCGPAASRPFDELVASAEVMSGGDRAAGADRPCRPSGLRQRQRRSADPDVHLLANSQLAARRDPVRCGGRSHTGV